MGLAVVGLIVLLIVALVAIPILARVLGQATRRNENRPEGEGSEEARPGDRGPGGEE
jgi:multisubunit Na+/H+ antiporter MnhG subunit